VQVTISYDPDLSKIGKTVTVEDDEGARLIREGRAVPEGKAVNADEPAGKPPAKATGRAASKGD
jgi:hypothetical protein